MLLSTPQSRLRLLLEKIAALIVALIVIGLLIGLLAVAGQASAKIDIDVAGAVLAGLNVSLLALFFAALALFLITDGLKWGPFFMMIGIAAVLLVLGVVQFSRSDVERGS